ncbi:MAG: hypothetical protein RJA61_490 [Candidatus Parcubacteria bacterium]
MKNIQSFLDKFQGLLFKKVKQEIVIEDVCKEVGIPLIRGDFTLKETVLSIKNNPILKTQIFLKKTSLLKKIEERLGKNIITDIR